MGLTPEAQDEIYRSPVETAIDLALEAMAGEQTTRTESSIRKEASSMTKNELSVAEEAWTELYRSRPADGPSR